MEALSLALNHPHPKLPPVADTMREALHLAMPCCANHACEVALLTAFSFAADVAKDDPVEMRRFIDALATHIENALKRGQIKFQRQT